MNTFYHKYSTMRRLVHFTILLLFVSAGAMAQTKFWVAPGASGNWSNAANWSNTSGGPGGAGAPVAGQNAIFNGNSTANCLMDVASVTINSLSITNAYSGTISPAGTVNMTLAGSLAIGGGTFVGPDNLVVTAGFVQSSGVFTSGNFTNILDAATFNGGTSNLNGTVQFNRNASYLPAHTINPGTSTVIVTGITNSALNINNALAGTVNFYNLTINKTTAGADNLNIGVGDVVIVENNFTLQNGFYRGANSSLQVGSGFAVEQTARGGIANLEFNGSQNGIVRINAPWTTNTSGVGTTIVNKSVPTATLSFVTDLPSNSILLNQTLTGNFQVVNGTIDFPDGDDVVWNYANIQTSPGGTISATNGNMTFFSNFNNSGTFIGNTGTVTFGGALNTTYSVGTTAQNGTTTFYNVVLNRTASSSLLIELGDRLTASNNLTIQNGHFTVPGGSITNEAFVQVGGNLEVLAGASTMPPSIHLEFGGPNPQTVSFAAGTSGHFNGNISLVKSAPGPITLNTPIVLDAASQLVTFTGGVVNTTNVNTINFAGNGAVATGGNASSHVDGPILRTGSTAFTFPTGDAGFYGPIHISGAGFNSNISNATYIAQYVRSSPDPLYPIDQLSPTNPPDLKISELEYWILDQQGPTVAGPRIWLSYSGNSGVTDPTTIGVTQWDNPGFWQLIGNGGLQNVAGASYVASASTNVSNVSSANPVFTLSTIDPIANPLPVTWLSFTGRYFNGSVDLNWSTSLEVNNEEYTIERSADGQNFTAIGNVPGVGNTTSISRYSFKDTNPLSGSAYYRIKQTDRDGKFSYSDVIRVSNNEVALKGIRLFPNPVSGNMPLTIENGNWSNKKVTITIYNAVGGIVRQEQITFGSDSRAKINVESLQKGSYFITTSINNERQTMQFFIQ